MQSGGGERLTRRRFLAVAGISVAGASAYGGWSNETQSTRTTLASVPGVAGAPRAPLRVALIADMHGPHNWVSQPDLIAAVAAFRPHLLCVVGDAVDEHGDEHMVSLYAPIEAPLGKFATLGNWEHEARCDLDLLRHEYERAGVRLLVNERVRLDHAGEPIELVGLDDWRAGSPHYEVVSGLEPGGAEAPRAVIMSHCPITFDEIANIAPRPTVTLAGHTHGGQIAPFGVALVTPEGSGRYVSGWYDSPDGAHHMYVTRGLGNSGPPFRVGARPELALMTL
jgi:uncharacterized protein